MCYEGINFILNILEHYKLFKFLGFLAFHITFITVT